MRAFLCTLYILGATAQNNGGQAVLRTQSKSSQPTKPAHQDKLNTCHCTRRGSSKPRAGAGITEACHFLFGRTCILKQSIAINPSSSSRHPLAHASRTRLLPPAINKSYDYVIATAAPLPHACATTACDGLLADSSWTAGCPGTTATSVKHNVPQHRHSQVSHHPH